MSIGDSVKSIFDEREIESPKDTRTIEARRNIYINELVENRGLNRELVEQVFNSSPTTPDAVYDLYKDTIAELREDPRVRTEDILSQALIETYYKLHPEEDPTIPHSDGNIIPDRLHEVRWLDYVEKHERLKQLLNGGYRPYPNLRSHNPFSYAAQRFIDRFERKEGLHATLDHLFDK